MEMWSPAIHEVQVVVIATHRLQTKTSQRQPTVVGRVTQECIITRSQLAESRMPPPACGASLCLGSRDYSTFKDASSRCMSKPDCIGNASWKEDEGEAHVIVPVYEMRDMADNGVSGILRR